MNSTNPPPKAPYTTPKLKVYGDIRAITQGRARPSGAQDDNSGRLKT